MSHFEQIHVVSHLRPLQWTEQVHQSFSLCGRGPPIPTPHQDWGSAWRSTRERCQLRGEAAVEDHSPSDNRAFKSHPVQKETLATQNWGSFGDVSGGSVGKNLPACQCRGSGLNPWSGNSPHVAEQLSLRARITLGSVLWNKRSHWNEKLTHQN